MAMLVSRHRRQPNQGSRLRLPPRHNNLIWRRCREEQEAVFHACMPPHFLMVRRGGDLVPDVSMRLLLALMRTASVCGGAWSGDARHRLARLQAPAFVLAWVVENTSNMPSCVPGCLLTGRQEHRAVRRLRRRHLYLAGSASPDD